MGWMVYGILAAVCFGSYNFFAKLSADKFSPTIGLLFLTATSFSVALVATLYFKLAGRPLVFTKADISLPLLAGLSTGLAEIFYLFMFSKNAPLGFGTALVIGGTAIVAAILGMIFLKEPIDLVKISGFVLVIGGLYFLSK